MSTFLQNWLERRAMSAPRGGGGAPYPFGYITDGLVFMLDGIDKGATPGRWENLAGSSYYELVNTYTLESNAVVTDGQNWILPNVNQGITSGTGTIELCAECVDTGPYGVIMSALRDCLGLYVYKDAGFAYAGIRLNNVWQFNGQFSTNSPYTVSLNSALALLNGSLDGIDPYTDNWSQSTYESIDGRNTGGTPYHYATRIHSIRIYNRQLTKAEMLANQQVDNTRFNLGLSI